MDIEAYNNKVVEENNQELGIELVSISNSVFELNKNSEDEEIDISGSLFGLRRSTITEMYDLYQMHARCVGFSVRKSTNILSSKAEILGKIFVCSNAGKKKEVDDSTRKRKRRATTRSGCQACMKIAKKEGLFEVVKHNLDHNHELTRGELSHLHRSQRQITDEKAEAINNMIDSGIKPMDSYRYMVYEVGGEENLGHTHKDHLNFIHRRKMEAIEDGDAESLIDIIQEEIEKDSDFFYRVKLKEGRLCNIFWRDSMMLEDFDVFGDVLVFDTTYRTNKYSLICAPFIGINNHWRNVMFGCAFLADEKIESFEWLFKVFKKSMRGKTPTTIFTDQDFAIAKAIEKVFPDTKHRLCQWHLYQNAITRFASLKGNNTFKDEFTKCFSGCVDEEEFEKSWSKMIETYGLEQNEWFARLYSLKEKWCTALSKDFFSAGIRSSQRSESTNRVISFNAKKKTSLTDFYSIFNETVKGWRRTEKDDEFTCSRCRPEPNIPIILKEAAEKYTIKIFQDVQEEFQRCISSYSILVGYQDSTMVYHVSSSISDTRRRTVVYDIKMNFISCSCKKFEECGILCYHCLRVLHINSAQSIPEMYIKKRWTKMAKSDIWEKTSNANAATKDQQVNIQWRNQLVRNYYNLILRSQDNAHTKRIMEEGYARDKEAVDSFLQVPNTSLPLEMGNSVLDPIQSTTKGRKAQRAKSILERKKKKKGKNDVQFDKNEFGSKTPNVRLI